MQIINEYDIKRLEKEDTTSFNLAGRGIDDEHLAEIVDVLNQYPRVTRLILDRNNFSDENNELTKLKHIKQLDLSRNNINKETVLPLLQKGEFEELRLDSNDLEDAGEVIANNTRQLRLTLERTRIPKEWMDKIKARVEENNQQKLQRAAPVSQTSSKWQDPKFGVTAAAVTPPEEGLLSAAKNCLKNLFVSDSKATPPTQPQNKQLNVK